MNLTTRPKSGSHGEAFRDLSMVERTVLNFLEDLYSGLEDEGDKEAVSRVEELVMRQ